MKKTIQILSIIILSLILLGVIIFIFNPLNLRNKIIGGMINSFFQIDAKQTKNNISPANLDKNVSSQDSVSDKNPLLSAEQEKKLEELGVDVEALPKEITPGMSACFIEKLGEERTNEIVAGDTPGPLEIIKTRECLNK